MQSDRLKQLLDFLEEDSNDAFTLYAIAIEYLKFDKEKSLTYFNLLLKDHAHYLATYYHAAALYAELGDNEKAFSIYEKGIELATAQQDMHTLSELKNAYTNLQMDDLL